MNPGFKFKTLKSWITAKENPGLFEIIKDQNDIVILVTF